MSSRTELTVFICSDLKSETLSLTARSFFEVNEAKNVEIGEIIIVANANISESARHELEKSLSPNSQPKRISVITEPIRGIPHARNRALRFARQRKLDWIAFVDDDCLVEDDWLVGLAEFIGKPMIGAVAGGWKFVPGTKPSKLVPASYWGRQDYYFGRRMLSGDVLPHAYTRTVAFSLNSLNDSELRELEFDVSRNNLGGSDVIFFKKIAEHGIQIVYAPKSQVKEIYSGQRVSLVWHMKRKLRNIQFRIERSQGGEVLLLNKSFAGLLAFPILTLLRANVKFSDERVKPHKPRALHLDDFGRLAIFLAQIWGISLLFFGKKQINYR